MKKKGHIGKRIARLRKMKNLTLPELADKSGVSKGYLSQLENDKIENPSIDTANKLAHALDTTIADLLDLPAVGQAVSDIEMEPGLEEFVEERRRKGDPVPEDIIRAMIQIKTRKKGPMTKDDWAYICETIYRVSGGR